MDAMTTQSAALVGMAAGLVTAAAAAAGGFLARGSTAMPAAVWAVVAALVLTAEMAATAAGIVAVPATAGCIRLVAAALAVCPTMSLLGAKRPQHGVWQFIVGSLAIVLVLPAVSAVLVRPGSFPEVHLLERSFLLVLAVLGWVNFAATRHGAAAAVLTAGQIALSWRFLPFADAASFDGRNADLFGAVAVAAAAVLALVRSLLSQRLATVAAAGGLKQRIDRPFLAVRETFGAAWTLRIAERFNAVAASRGWPCRLHFGGLDQANGADVAGWQEDAARGFAALLRRFVSREWLDRHGWRGNDGGTV